MKKEKIKNILLIVIVALVTSFVTAYGVSSTFDSSNVCYKVDSNTGASVQDTIDDLYGKASDYSELKSYFQNNPTSYFDGNGLSIGINQSSTSNSNTNLFIYNKGIHRGTLYYDLGSDEIRLTSRNSSETYGTGTLNLSGNPVKINGTNISELIKVMSVDASKPTANGWRMTPTIPSGYKFLCWLYAYANGTTITMPYAASATEASSRFYIDNDSFSKIVSSGIRAYYLVIKE